VEPKEFLPPLAGIGKQSSREVIDRCDRAFDIQQENTNLDLVRGTRQHQLTAAWGERYDGPKLTGSKRFVLRAAVIVVGIRAMIALKSNCIRVQRHHC
jgi:hypothetical protein